MHPSHDRFCTAVRDGEVMFVEVVGEVDCRSIADFEAELVRASGSRYVVVDLTGTDFFSGGAYAAVGRLSREVEQLTVWSTSGLARRVFVALGFPDVNCVVNPELDAASRLRRDSARRKSPVVEAMPAMAARSTGGRRRDRCAEGRQVHP
jgi:anti-anti-sigma regulatory factor